MNIIPQKPCSTCKNSFPATLEFFYRDKSKPDYLATQCKPCKNASHDQSREKRRIAQTHPDLQCCSKCKQWKPATLEFFSSAPKEKRHLHVWCKQCMHQAYRDQHPIKEVEIIPVGYRRCNVCNQLKPANTDFFYSDDSVKCGLQAACKPCERIRLIQKSKEFRTRHPERTSAWGRNRKCRVRDTKGKHTGKQIREQYDRQRGRCYYCRNKVKWGEHHVDHTFPVSRVAGTDIPANSIEYLVITCEHCNLSKGNKYPWEWPEGNRLL